MPTPRKTPQDHRSPSIPGRADEPFIFEHDGKTFHLAAATDVLTAGYARKNRQKSVEDQLFSMLEILADDDALDAIDAMKRDEFTKFQEDFFDHIGAKPGE